MWLRDLLLLERIYCGAEHSKTGFMNPFYRLVFWVSVIMFRGPRGFVCPNQFPWSNLQLLSADNGCLVPSVMEYTLCSCLPRTGWPFWEQIFRAATKHEERAWGSYHAARLCNHLLDNAINNPMHTKKE
jgi:hypothetical protein